MKNSSVIKLIGVVVILAAAGGALLKFRSRSAEVKLALAPKLNASSLYEPRDKPVTIFLKAVEMESGRPTNITAVIRQSKSRYNQMKQAVLAFLRGPRSGKFQVPVPEGMELNEFYFTPLGVAVVDLSVSQVKPGGFGFYEETAFIKGIIEVLSRNFFEVKQVKILVEGQDAPTLMGHYALGTNENNAPGLTAAASSPIN